jgi:hypothetical protein
MRPVKKELYLPRRQFNEMYSRMEFMRPVYKVKWDVADSVRDQIRVAVDFHVYKAN